MPPSSKVPIHPPKDRKNTSPSDPLSSFSSGPEALLSGLSSLRPHSHPAWRKVSQMPDPQRSPDIPHKYGSHKALPPAPNPLKEPPGTCKVRPPRHRDQARLSAPAAILPEAFPHDPTEMPSIYSDLTPPCQMPGRSPCIRPATFSDRDSSWKIRIAAESNPQCTHRFFPLHRFPQTPQTPGCFLHSGLPEALLRPLLSEA